MNPALTILAALSALAAPPAPANIDPAPASDALVERFLAVIPDAEQISHVEWDIGAEQRRRLDELNPGRAGDIQAVADDYRRCTSPVATTTTQRMLRDIARGLGEEKLGRLVQFYQSSDLQVLRALAERNQSGETLSEAERAEAARITEAYPVADFIAGLGRVQVELFQDEAFVNAVLRCEEEMQAGLAGRNLRAE